MSRISWTYQESSGVFGRDGHLRLFWGKQRKRCVAEFWVRRDGTTWHTWDQRGIGGENSTDKTVLDSMNYVLLSLVRQGFIPSLTTVEARYACNEANRIDEARRAAREAKANAEKVDAMAKWCEANGQMDPPYE